MRQITPYHGYLMLWQRIYGLFIVQSRPELDHTELGPKPYDETMTWNTAKLETLVKRQVEACFGSL